MTKIRRYKKNNDQLVDGLEITDGTAESRYMATLAESERVNVPIEYLFVCTITSTMSDLLWAVNPNLAEVMREYAKSPIYQSRIKAVTLANGQNIDEVMTKYEEQLKEAEEENESDE